MPDTPPLTRLERFARIAQIAQGLSIIIGIAVAVANIYTSRESAAFSLRNMRLSSLQHIGAVIREDGEVQKKITTLNIKGLPAFSSLLAKYDGRARNVYFSPELKDVFEIGEHFERMGALVRLGYIEFDLLYAIIPFPDEFWEESREWRAALRENWHERDKALVDFWSNFKDLCDRYQRQRHLDRTRLKQGASWLRWLPKVSAAPPTCAP
jgi:hypothetical protein